MNVLQNAQNTRTHTQDASLTAVDGNQEFSCSVTMTGPQNIASNRNIYQTAPLEGKFLKLQTTVRLPDERVKIYRQRPSVSKHLSCCPART